MRITDVHPSSTITGAHGMASTTLHLAARYGHDAVARCILRDPRVDVNARDL